MAETEVKEEISAPEVETSSKPVKKVELDLDDAPFLQADEPPPPPAPIGDIPSPEAAGDDKAKKKKKLIIFGAIGAVLVLAIAAVWLFFFRSPPPPPDKGLEPEIIVVPSAPADAGPKDLVKDFAPFHVPINDKMDQTVFLICKFSAITKEPAVEQEMTQQELPLRDAIYFYLRGKDANFILDARNGDAIKKDLLSVFNDYLSKGKLEDIVFESYLNK